MVPFLSLANMPGLKLYSSVCAGSVPRETGQGNVLIALNGSIQGFPFFPL